MKPAVPRSQRPAIWADAMRLAVEIEQAVRGFSRYHKYTLGVDLRRQAALICQLVGQAARFAHQRPRTLERLVMAVEALKTSCAGPPRRLDRRRTLSRLTLTLNPRKHAP